MNSANIELFFKKIQTASNNPKEISETVQFLMAEQSLIFLFGLLFYAFDEAFYCAFDVVGYFLYLFFGGFYCAFGE